MATNERTLRLDQPLADHLSVIAQVQERSINALIVQAVEEYVCKVENDETYLASQREWFNALTDVVGEKYGPRTSES